MDRPVADLPVITTEDMDVIDMRAEVSKIDMTGVVAADDETSVNTIVTSALATMTAMPPAATAKATAVAEMTITMTLGVRSAKILITMSLGLETGSYFLLRSF
jgi:hypothetical protein